jgi:hypothetical protein
MGGVANFIKTFAGKVINVVKDAAGFVWETIVPAVLTIGIINIVAAPFSIVAQLGLTIAGTGFGKYGAPPFGGLMRGILETIPILGPATIKGINAFNSVVGDVTQAIGVPYVYIGWCSEEQCLI